MLGPIGFSINAFFHEQPAVMKRNPKALSLQAGTTHRVQYSASHPITDPHFACGPIEITEPSL